MSHLGTKAGRRTRPHTHPKKHAQINNEFTAFFSLPPSLHLSASTSSPLSVTAPQAAQEAEERSISSSHTGCSLARTAIDLVA